MLIVMINGAFLVSNQELNLAKANCVPQNCNKCNRISNGLDFALIGNATILQVVVIHLARPDGRDNTAEGSTFSKKRAIATVKKCLQNQATNDVTLNKSVYSFKKR